MADEMNENLRLIIADADIAFCDTLLNTICFQDLKLTWVKTLNDGISLLAAIEEIRPEIVITSVSLSRMSGLEVIEHVKQKGMDCNFLVIDTGKNFDHVLRAMKNDVDDFFVKPVTPDELNSALWRTATKVRHKQEKKSYKSSNNDVMRLYFAQIGINEIWNKPSRVEEVNKIYKTNFKRGLFTMLAVKLDYPGSVADYGAEFSVVLSSIGKYINELFHRLCNDILFDIRADCVKIIINYDASRKADVHAVYQKMSDYAVKAAASLPCSATLCVSETVNDVNELKLAWDQVRTAIWARMAYGVNRIICSEKIESGGQYVFDRKRKLLERRITDACNLLNAEEFRDAMDEFFSYPAHVLCRNETRQFMMETLNSFFSMCERRYSGILEAGYEHQTKMLLLPCTSMEEYKKAYCARVCGAIALILEQLKRDNSLQVRYARLYISRHVNEKITLDMVAEYIGMNATYLSSQFKKATGTSFSSYVNEVKAEEAKAMLDDSMMSIKQIAERLGYNDSAYFSKCFKRCTGLAPKQYRWMKKRGD